MGRYRVGFRPPDGDPVRGCLLGLVLGLALWAGVIFAVVKLAW